MKVGVKIELLFNPEQLDPAASTTAGRSLIYDDIFNKFNAVLEEHFAEKCLVTGMVVGLILDEEGSDTGGAAGVKPN